MFATSPHHGSKTLFWFFSSSLQLNNTYILYIYFLINPLNVVFYDHHLPNAAFVSAIDFEREQVAHAHISKSGQGLEETALEEPQLVQPLGFVGVHGPRVQRGRDLVELLAGPQPTVLAQAGLQQVS